MAELTHFDERGASRMVDTSDKPETQRLARASAVVRMAPATLALIRDRGLSKGDVLEVARLAGIMAAKRTGPHPAVPPAAHHLRHGRFRLRGRRPAAHRGDRPRLRVVVE